MRDIKKALIHAIRRSNNRIREIDFELGHQADTRDLWEPAIDPREYPDDWDVISPEELEKYMELRTKHKEWLKTPSVSNGTISNRAHSVPKKDDGSDDYETASPPIAQAQVDLELTLADSKALTDLPPSQSLPQPFELDDNPLKAFVKPADSPETVTAVRNLHTIIPGLGNILSAKRGITSLTPSVAGIQNNDAKKDALQQAQLERKGRLRFERFKLLSNIDENVSAFKDAIDQMRVDRHTLSTDLKQAELKLLNLFQEYIILLNFQVQDNQLIEKQKRSKSENIAIETQIKELKEQLEQLLHEKQQYVDKLTDIGTEYAALLPENHPYYDQLRKIYKKKARRNALDMEDDDEDEEEEEEEEDEDEEDLDDVDDACPPGCDSILHEKLLDLRESRMDNEEADKALEKKYNETKRSMDKLAIRLKQIVKDVNQSAVSIRALQREKQAALNMVDLFVPLSASQIYMFNLSGALTGPEMPGQQEEAALLDATAVTETGAPAADANRDGVQVAQSKSKDPQDNPQTRTNNSDTNTGLAPSAGSEEVVDTTLLKDPLLRSLNPKAGEGNEAAFVLFPVDALNQLKGRIGGLKAETEEAFKLYQQLKKERVVLSRARDTQQEKITNWKENVRIYKC